LPGNHAENLCKGVECGSAAPGRRA
jgi:hypothetical protein